MSATAVLSPERSVDPRARESSDPVWLRRGAVIGPVAAVVLYVGLSMFGDTPDPGDPAAQIDAYFVSNRTGMLIGVVLVGAAMSGLVAVVARLGHQLDRAGGGMVGRLAMASATVAAAAITAGMLLPYAALSSVIGADVPEFGKGLFELTIMLTPVVAIPLAALTAATGIGLWRAGIGRPWFLRASVLVAPAFLVSACSFADGGAFSPDVQQQVVFTLLAGWLIASGFGARELSEPPRRRAA